MSRDKYKNIIEKRLNITYDKNDSKILEIYFIPKIGFAVENSKKVWQKKVLQYKNNNNGKVANIYDLYTVTTVYKLIEFLKIKTRR